MKRTIITITVCSLSGFMSAQTTPPSTVDGPASNQAQLISEYQQEVSDLQSMVKKYKAKCETLEKQLQDKKGSNSTQAAKAPIATVNVPQKPESEPTSPGDATPNITKIKQALNDASPQEMSLIMKYWQDGLSSIISKRKSGEQGSDKTTLTGGGQMKIDGRTVTVKSDMNRTCSLNCPIKMSDNYDIELLFTRQLGQTEIDFVLPVGGTAAKLVLDKYQGTTYDLLYRKYVAGLEYINGLGVLENNTRVSDFNLTNGIMHSLDIKVRMQKGKTAIVAFLDEQEIVNWKGPVTELSAFPAQLSAQPSKFSIQFAPKQTVKLSNMRVKNFDKKPASKE